MGEASSKYHLQWTVSLESQYCMLAAFKLTSKPLGLYVLNDTDIATKRVRVWVGEGAPVCLK